jgi:hypothetical protein
MACAAWATWTFISRMMVVGFSIFLAETAVYRARAITETTASRTATASARLAVLATY